MSHVFILKVSKCLNMVSQLMKLNAHYNLINDGSLPLVVVAQWAAILRHKSNRLNITIQKIIAYYFDYECEYHIIAMVKLMGVYYPAFLDSCALFELYERGTWGNATGLNTPADE